ncbi:growth arrest and DNA damage-inducible protein GADD45 beta-like [Asterias amurensis]|uniref:growth arrest and DNA damage-inducible protein GADD45 beta-like n=1 Tax=Asterias amurensis TaxID=7602 RepID=UPI003AB6ECC7
MKFDEESDWNIKATTRHCINNMIKMDAGMALERVLISAKLEGRITYGVYQSVRKLGIIDPQRVMVCLHADDNADEDVALHIHFTLMEAFCRENSIRLIKVDCHESLARLLRDTPPTQAVDNNPTPPAHTRVNTEDFVCLLVDFPKELDDDDYCFLELYHTLAQEMPFPRISVAA